MQYVDDRTPEEKKEEYRKYLEKAGVVEVLVGLYEEPERPPNAIEYIKRYFGAPHGVDVEALRQENTELQEDNAELKKIIEQLAKSNQELKDQLAEYEG
ncbi:C-Myc-binding protein-like [Hondaea fermentalgiana]|uniref:c-Myc-binding protein-like n=1 Tax=Hondaea fermentalgiana TaxID=2315210 RepID=A0A2R5G2D2_9STRA|nr:C-Myc-binding protein-like [Hondaea fermentalgiana]|eukprot:GBG25170.1 C-Myc-binding protein-like [Hondaea fermentalgiana]